MNPRPQTLLFAWTFVVAAAACAGRPTPLAREASFADTVIKRARIYTVDNANPWAQSVAVRSGRIIAVGSDAETEKLTGPSTRVVDAAGRFVMPGFIDSHTHIFVGALSAQRVNLSLADSLPKLRAYLQAIRDQNPGQSPIYARGWQNHLFPKQGPRKEILDEIFGSRAVVLGSVDGHSTWFSSKALELAGVDADTPDPQPGVSFFERDPVTKEPLGTAREAASALVTPKIIQFKRETYQAALKKWLPQAAAAGLTAVFDAGATAPTQEDAYRILQSLENNGNLTLRVYGSVMYAGDGDQPAKRLLALRGNYEGQYYRPYSIKLFVDGVPEGHTAFLLAPYVDQPDTRGEPMISPDRLNAIISDAFALDVAVHVHAIGGGAIRMTLDAIEIARASTSNREVPAAIAHMDFVDAADIPRFARLSVFAQTSIQWAAADPSYDSIGGFVGMDVVEAAYPVKALLDAGAVVTFGADWPASAYLSTYEPLTLLEMAVTRRLPGNVTMPIRNAAQRLPVEEAIECLTLRSARMLGVDGEIGSIQVGKKADVIILDADILKIPAHEIHGTQVLLTMMDGRIVHRAAPFAAMVER